MYIVDSGRLNVFRTSEDTAGQPTTCLLKQVGQVSQLRINPNLKNMFKIDSNIYIANHFEIFLRAKQFSVC